jgi:hypothetical protein
MSIVAVETFDERAMELLRQLEQLNIIRLLPGEVTVAPALAARRPLPPPADPTIDVASLIGSISHETAEAMHREVEQMRNEWERDF